MLMFCVRPRIIKRFLLIAGVVVILLSAVGRILVQAAGTNANDSLAWAAPSHMAMRRISGLGTVQNQPNFLSNLNCDPLTYRMVGSNIMQNGCFTPTAFGKLDSDSEKVIFNGTDEALPLSAYSPHEVLAPWTSALNLVTLDALDTGGSYIGLYQNPLLHLQDQRNFSGQLTSKQFTAPPDMQLRDPSGQRLVINAQTMAFSDGGAWLVAETLGGSFVRINLSTLDMTAFAPAFGSQGSPALLKSQVTVSHDGRFVAIENMVAGSFKVYDLSTCGGAAVNLQPRNCQVHDYWSFVNQQASGVQAIRHVRFLNDGILSFEITSSNASASGTYEMAPTDSIKSLTGYIGLGDSYTSGEGAFDYLSGTDTSDNTCHLSSNSYSLLLTHDLFGAAGGHSVACSGAVINDLGSVSDSYRGQVRGGASFGELESGTSASSLSDIQADFSPGYIAQHWFVGQYQPQTVTVSIGGNDIGFGDLLQNCVEPHISRHTSDATCYNTYESREQVVQLVDRTVPRWTALYKQLLAEDPGVQLYAIGYPSIASDTGSCGLNVNLSKSELEFAEELISYLNGSIQRAAVTAGVPYVDISQALAGHRLCEATGNAVAVNGLTAGKDSGVLGFGVLGRESYHPNALGHELIEQTILRQTANLTTGAATTPAASSQNLLNVPKSGAAISNWLSDDTLSSPIFHTNASNTVQADGMRDGLKPNNTYSVRLDGATGSSLITAVSDANGNLTTAITLPSNTSVGGHTIDITGSNQVGEPVDISQPIYVAGSSGDSDGDNIADIDDSCPYAANSGQDMDNDGIDDTCDGTIGPAQGGSNPSSGTSPPPAQSDSLNTANSGSTATDPLPTSPPNQPGAASQGPPTTDQLNSMDLTAATDSSVALRPAAQQTIGSIKSEYSSALFTVIAVSAPRKAALLNQPTEQKSPPATYGYIQTGKTHSELLDHKSISSRIRIKGMADVRPQTAAHNTWPFDSVIGISLALTLLLVCFCYVVLQNREGEHI